MFFPYTWGSIPIHITQLVHIWYSLISWYLHSARNLPCTPEEGSARVLRTRARTALKIFRSIQIASGCQRGCAKTRTSAARPTSSPSGGNTPSMIDRGRGRPCTAGPRRCSDQSGTHERGRVVHVCRSKVWEARSRLSESRVLHPNTKYNCFSALIAFLRSQISKIFTCLHCSIQKN